MCVCVCVCALIIVLLFCCALSGLFCGILVFACCVLFFVVVGCCVGGVSVWFAVSLRFNFMLCLNIIMFLSH